LLGYHPRGRIAEAETKGIGFHATVADDALIRGLLIAPPPFPLSESTTRTEKTFCNARTPENHDGRKMDSVTVTGSLTNSDRGANYPGLPPVVLHGRRKPWVRGRQRGDDVRGSLQLPVLSSPSWSGSSSRRALRGYSDGVVPSARPRRVSSERLHAIRQRVQSDPLKQSARAPRGPRSRSPYR